MSPSSLAALFAAMAILATIPSLNVLLVASRAASCGLGHGFAAAAGVVLGDQVLIYVAVFGLAVVANGLGEWFVLVRLLAGLHLIWLGWRMWRASAPAEPEEVPVHSPWWSSAGAGFLLTLTDQKALLFYFSFLPAFLALGTLSAPDVVLLSAVTVLAVGGVKAAYAYLAARSSVAVSPRQPQLLNKLAAVMLAMGGVAVVVRA